MKMFLGEYSPNITEGSRISLPKKIREQLDNGVVLAKGFEKCIYIYDKKDWITEAKKQVENSGESAKIRDLERYLYTSAVEAEIDSQGRIVIPAYLAVYANLSERIVFLGLRDRVEVWDEAEWAKREKEIATNAAQLIEKLAEKNDKS